MSQDQKRESEVVVITGASAGVGRAVAREFARRGARVALIARGLEGLDAARVEVEALGGQALVFSADVSIPIEVDRAARAVVAAWGGIDVWINNAMTSVLSPVKEMTAADFGRVTDVTYLGTVYGTLAALRTMLPRDRGTIVQVGSALGYRSIPLQSAYCAAKHAIVGFTDSLRSELIHDASGVHLTMVNLPATNTPQFGWMKSRLPCKAQPVPPIYQPEVAARAIHWAAHHQRRQLNVGLPTVEAIWGQKVAPSLLDRYLAHEGYDGQQLAEPADPAQRSNLWAPVRGDHGAHGDFDDRAQPRSLQLWASMNRTLVAASMVGLSLVAVLGIGMSRRVAR